MATIYPDHFVTLLITDSYGEEVYRTNQRIITDDGTFWRQIAVEGLNWNEGGQYTLTAQYKWDTASVHFNFIDDGYPLIYTDYNVYYNFDRTIQVAVVNIDPTLQTRIIVWDSLDFFSTPPTIIFSEIIQINPNGNGFLKVPINENWERSASYMITVSQDQLLAADSFWLVP